MKKVISCNGCLLFIILFFILMAMSKYWFFVLLVLIVLLNIGYFDSAIKMIKKYLFSEPSYKSKVGKVYKQCVFCETKTDRNTKICPKCKRSFE